MASAATPYLIDANIYLGFTNEEDSLHAKAKDLIEELNRNGSSCVLLDHVIQEILTVLLYGGQHASIRSFMETFLIDQNVFPVDTPISWMNDAISLATQQNFKPKMSLTDWLLLSRSLMTGAPILTFDKQLLAASKKLC